MALAGGPTVTLTFKGDVDDLKRAIASVGTMITGLGATVGILGGIGAAASAVVLAVAAVPLAFAGIGIAAAAQQQIVKDRFTALKNHVMAEMASMTASIQGELLISADHMQAWFDRLRPTFENLFKLSAPYVTQMVDAILGLVEKSLPGLQTALQNAKPIMEVFARGLGMLGEGLGNFFAKLSEGTPGAVIGLDALFRLTRDLLTYLGQLVGQLANALGPAFAALHDPLMRIVTALGDGLLRIVQALAPHVGDLGKAIADFLTAALDILVPIVEAIVPLLADMAKVMMESLTPILRDLGPILVDVVKALAEGLKPVIPIVAQAFRDMAPTIKEIAEKAGPLLVKIIDALAPLFVTLVEAALDLTKALLPVIPPLLDMANNAMPLVKGVIQDVLIPVIKWLVEEFKGLIEYGVKIADKFAELSVRWRTYWDEIKAAFADADRRIRAGIDGFVSLGETARKHWDAMYQAIKGKIEEIVAWAVAFPQRIIDGIMGYFERMYQAGAGLMQRFADGINSKAQASQDAAGNVVGGTAALFPQSPAKIGPFSGSGYTYDRGQKLIDDFGKGITDAGPRLADLARQALQGASVAIQGFTGQGGTARADVPGVGNLELKVAPGADSALASLLMNLVRTGQLQLARA